MGKGSGRGEDVKACIENLEGKGGRDGKGKCIDWR